MRSSLEIFDMATGQVRVVWQSEGLAEAPNWDARADALLINRDGRLWRVPLSGGAPRPVDTGFADRCNNDHGISPDGGQIALSHHGQNGAVIHLMPHAGGTPKAITAPGSYWHGWSPDGARLAYCGKREGRFDIYTCALDGGDERRLTGLNCADDGHNDGPDYGADGAHIWFNSDRVGHAQIYRMKADGSQLTRMTHDDHVNWFPHPSPSGGPVLYLAYPPGTEGHPADRDVALILIDPDGGNARAVARFNGGQGTINVPCWAPDGSAFAYMRYMV